MPNLPQKYDRRKILIVAGVLCAGAIAYFRKTDTPESVSTGAPPIDEDSKQAEAPVQNVFVEHSELVEQQGTEFTVMGSEVGISLIHVSPLVISEGDGRKFEGFSLLFKGPKENPLEQRIHELHHADLGTLSLFLAPVGRPKVGVEYEAVISQQIS
jgi:hypothetical protein